MQLILREDVYNLGKAGELVAVKPGYGRNYLIPQGLAMAATAGNVKQIEHEKKIIAAKKAATEKDARVLADRLATVEVQIERQVGQGDSSDKIFGSVTSRDIAEALKAKGHTIDAKKLVLTEAIKTIGFQTVELKLGGGISASIKVVVVPKQ